jgi:hypothetical protein
MIINGPNAGYMMQTEFASKQACGMALIDKLMAQIENLDKYGVNGFRGHNMIAWCSQK